ncbi:LOW QUALITY PROTEIN: feruloyl esterase [Purpureocillium lavendulum]|uniref:Carboxylic ester hydrolase n=1 Tax=Purpureocillium lavendulum TaxID=1247861 RepID=A0AB34FUP2_9HYPO|nr:LOW QUALITY PROTEIN: feruloyl esterase [Purpureocillium lavendulum]
MEGRLARPVRALVREPPARQVPLVGRQPARRLGVVGQQEPDEDGGDDGGDALEDEEPAPAREAAGLVHVADAVRDGAAKGARERRRREDGGHADGALLGAVPERQVVDEAGEEACATFGEDAGLEGQRQGQRQLRRTGFKHAQQEAHDGDGRVVARAAQAHGDGAPRQHEEGDPAAGAQALEEVVGGHLEERVGDEEDHEGNGVLVGRHAGLVEQVVAGGRVEDLGVADVGAVEVAEQVDGRRERDDAQVLLAEEGPRALGVVARRRVGAAVVVLAGVSSGCATAAGDLAHLLVGLDIVLDLGREPEGIVGLGRSHGGGLVGSWSDGEVQDLDVESALKPTSASDADGQFEAHGTWHQDPKASYSITDMFSIFVSLVWAAVADGLGHRPSPQQQCRALAGLEVAEAVITNTSYVPAGAVSIPGSGATNTDPFCRLYGTRPYAGNNSVEFEVWLPDRGRYNDRLLVVGNGGMAGTIDESALLTCVNRDFACAGGDAGHRASENNNGSGAPGVFLPYLHDRAQTLAWIRDSIAYMTPPARSIVAAAYDRAPRYAYYQGCSTGGAQGFALAQHHPHLFDGIVAGSPGNWYSHLALSFLWNSVDDESPSYLPQSALDLITEAAIAKCDTLDGVADGVIENPLACDFDIDSLRCYTGDSPCLTDEQVKQAKKIYSGPRGAYPGFSVGSESSWAVQEGSLADAFSIPILQNLVFGDLAYNASTFDWDADVALVDERAGALIDDISPDLSGFRAHGGKLVVTQAWADPYNAASWPMQHRAQMQRAMGDVDDWFALFMVPAQAQWHSLDALMSWVEGGHRPTEMLSSSPADGSNTTRKLCPWPATAKYTGGDVGRWTSYTCGL